MLELYTENKDMDKVSALKKEMKYFNIHIGSLSFGLDNTGFIIDKENNCINQSLKTVKFLNSQICEDMKILGKQNITNFPNLLQQIKSETSVNTRQLDVLIKINYFNEFGSIKKLLTFVEWYNKLIKKTYKKDGIDFELENYIKGNSGETEKMYKNLDKEVILQSIWNDLKDEDISFIEKATYQKELLGYIELEIPKDISLATCEMVSVKHRSINLKSMRNNETKWFKIEKGKKLPSKGDMLVIYKTYKKAGYKQRVDLYLEKYEII